MRCRAAIMLLAAAALAPPKSAAAGEAEIVSALRRQIARCWVLPSDVTRRTTPVTLTFRLGRDGSVQSVPLIVRNPAVLEYGKFFVISASDAIKACQPYRLPIKDYELWKEVKITFRPPEN